MKKPVDAAPKKRCLNAAPPPPSMYLSRFSSASSLLSCMTSLRPSMPCCGVRLRRLKSAMSTRAAMLRPSRAARLRATVANAVTAAISVNRHCPVPPPVITSCLSLRPRRACQRRHWNRCEFTHTASPATACARRPRSWACRHSWSTIWRTPTQWSRSALITGAALK